MPVAKEGDIGSLEFIADMLDGLRGIALGQRRPFLIYLIEMSRKECRDNISRLRAVGIADRRRSASGRGKAA